MSRGRQLAIQLGLVIATLAIWEVVVRMGVFDARLLPPPTEVFGRVRVMLSDPEVLHHLWVTTSEVFLAFILVAPLGVGLGLWLGAEPSLGQASQPCLFVTASVRKSVFLPLLIPALGIGFTQTVALGMFQAIFVLVISAIAAADSAPSEFIKMSRAFGATKRQLYQQIY